MTYEELRATSLQAQVYFCAELGYAPSTRVKRTCVSLASRIVLAARHGCSPGARVAVRCRCGAAGAIEWQAPTTPRQRGWVFVIDLEIDHVRPLALGGSNDVDNLQLLCRRCNRSKRDRWVG
jgi:5-methylcytosine-specific restriction endonuclease McrA